MDLPRKFGPGMGPGVEDEWGMPRINIEDDWFDDPRREALIAKIGIVADAVALRMWRLAQTYFRNRKLTPATLFEQVPYWQEFEAAGLAERRGDHVYIRGQGERFAWLLQKSEAGARGGRASAKSRSENTEENSKQKQANASKSKQTQASSSSSSSSSASSSTSGSASKEEAAHADASAPSPAKAFIEAYCDAFRGRYGTNPQIIGKDAGIAKRLAKDLGVGRARDLVGTYLSMNDPFFLTKRHDLGTFATNLNAVTVKHETGAAPTRAQINEVDRRQTNANVWGPILEKAEAEHGKR